MSTLPPATASGSTPAPALANTAALSLNAPHTPYHQAGAGSSRPSFLQRLLPSDMVTPMLAAGVVAASIPLLLELYKQRTGTATCKSTTLGQGGSTHSSSIPDSKLQHKPDEQRVHFPVSRSISATEQFQQSDTELLEQYKRIQFGREARHKVFELRDNTLFANHGSYGVVPSYVLAKQQQLLTLIDRHSDQWYRHESWLQNRHALKLLAPLLGKGVDPEDLTFVVNATTAVNAALNSIELKPGDVVLVWSVTYRACANAAHAAAKRAGAKYVEAELRLPIKDDNDIVQQLQAQIDKYGADKMKFVLMDTISSPIPVRNPYQKLCQLCKKHNIPILIDGAHSVGQETADEIDLANMGCTYFTSNIHKWAYTPKGCAVLYTAKEAQESIHPVVTSHYYRENYQMRFHMQGTRDDSAFVTAQHSVHWMNAVGLKRIQQYCRKLANFSKQHLDKLFGNSSADDLFPASMAAPNLKHILLPFVPPSVHDYKHKGNPQKHTVEQVNAEANEFVWKTVLEMNLNMKWDMSVSLFYTEHNMRLWLRTSANIYNDEQDYIDLGQKLIEYAAELGQPFTPRS